MRASIVATVLRALGDLETPEFEGASWACLGHVSWPGCWEPGTEVPDFTLGPGYLLLLGHLTRTYWPFWGAPASVSHLPLCPAPCTPGPLAPWPTPWLQLFSEPMHPAALSFSLAHSPATGRSSHFLSGRHRHILPLPALPSAPCQAVVTCLLGLHPRSDSQLAVAVCSGPTATLSEPQHCLINSRLGLHLLCW